MVYEPEDQMVQSEPVTSLGALPLDALNNDDSPDRPANDPAIGRGPDAGATDRLVVVRPR
jgi:hypothetical protein